MKTSELRLGDRVRPKHPASRAFTDMVVKQIKNDEITFFRPYAHTADFSYTGGVICYVGIEEFSAPVNDRDEYDLLETVNLR